jgi:hypothetical protein
MNYERIYNQIIERAKSRQLEGYIERHHIIPKCMGGTNDKENIINLTAREHYLCHMLLVEIYPNEVKLKYALWLMTIGKRRNIKCDYGVRVNSRIYERLRLEHSLRVKDKPKPEGFGKKVSISNLGKKHTLYTKQKMSCSKKSMSQETKDKISLSHKGRKDTNNTKLKKSLSHKGKKLTEEHKNNISINKKNKPNPIISLKLKGKPRSQETKDKISKALLGIKRKIKEKILIPPKVKKVKIKRKMSQETKDKIYTISRNDKISKSNKGRKVSNNTRTKQSLAKLNKKSNASKAIIQYSLNMNYIRDWDNMTEASKYLGRINNNSSISLCCKGKQKTAFGFKWKYKNNEYENKS